MRPAPPGRIAGPCRFLPMPGIGPVRDLAPENAAHKGTVEGIALTGNPGRARAGAVSASRNRSPAMKARGERGACTFSRVEPADRKEVGAEDIEPVVEPGSRWNTPQGEATMAARMEEPGKGNAIPGTPPEGQGTREAPCFFPGPPYPDRVNPPEITMPGTRNGGSPPRKPALPRKGRWDWNPRHGKHGNENAGRRSFRHCGRTGWRRPGRWGLSHRLPAVLPYPGAR